MRGFPPSSSGFGINAKSIVVFLGSRVGTIRVIYACAVVATSCRRQRHAPRPEEDQKLPACVAVHSFCVSEQGCTPARGHCKIQWSAMGAGAAHGAKKPARNSCRLDAISPNSGRIALYCALSRSTRNAPNHAALRSGEKVLAPVPETYLFLDSYVIMRINSLPGQWAPRCAFLGLRGHLPGVFTFPASRRG